MTTERSSQQGEHSVDRALVDLIGPALSWTSTPMWPAQCVAVGIVVHQDPASARYGYFLEVSDPHTKELLAKVADPTCRYSNTRSISATVAMDVRRLLDDLFDPDPF